MPDFTCTLDEMPAVLAERLEIYGDRSEEEWELWQGRPFNPRNDANHRDKVVEAMVAKECDLVMISNPDEREATFFKRGRWVRIAGRAQANTPGDAVCIAAIRALGGSVIGADDA